MSINPKFRRKCHPLFFPLLDIAYILFVQGRKVCLSLPQFFLENNVKVDLGVTNTSVLVNLIGKYHKSESGVLSVHKIVVKYI